MEHLTKIIKLLNLIKYITDLIKKLKERPQDEKKENADETIQETFQQNSR